MLSFLELQLGNLYKSGRGTSIVSQKSSEESVTNAVFILQPIAKEQSLSDLSSSMASKTHASTSGLETQSMAFNVKLTFVRTNIHDA